MPYNPGATYRVQLSSSFTLKQLRDIIPYLQRLGISTLYASPVFAARKGSTHGYDVTNPHVVNPEIGTIEDFWVVSQELKNAGIGWLQDIVPNHMAYDFSNKWLMDVLEKGPASHYYTFFDIDWHHYKQGQPQQVMVPFLGNQLEECVKNDEIKLQFSGRQFVVSYYDNKYPVSISTYYKILERDHSTELREAFALAKNINKSINDQDAEKLKELLYIRKHEAEEIAEKVNQDKEWLLHILNHQNYKLCHWQNTEKEINYRRFFTINDLICLRMQDPNVLQTYHRFIEDLLQKGVIDGLRIDHIDGLYDPEDYLNTLRDLFGHRVYVVIEKILEQEETIDKNWPIQGTTGYDFLPMVSSLFVNADAEQQFKELYSQFIEKEVEYEEVVWKNKKYILENRMQGELTNLLHIMHQLKLAEDVPEEIMKEVFTNLMLSFSVYRTYINKYPFSETDQHHLQLAFEKVRKQSTTAASAAINQLEKIFTPHENGWKDKERLAFIRRMQQFTGPLEAKGVEDTTFYTYNLLCSLNEVGGSPGTFSIPIDVFHKKMINRQQNMPLTINTTATHDTKRGEDARQWLNALSEIPEEWKQIVTNWKQVTEPLKTEVNGKPAPYANDEYLIFQSFVAFYNTKVEDKEDFRERILPYIEKALREGKENSNWSDPNEEYESATRDFVDKLIDSNDFMNEFLPFQEKISKIAYYKSLSQLLIKMFAPGVPDIYQGRELFDFSMVDPDNRRPVNYQYRKRVLNEVSSIPDSNWIHFINDMLYNMDERMKMYLTYHSLHLRRRNANLFSYGEYIPLRVEGPQQKNIIAFARYFENQYFILAVPLFPGLIAKGEENLGPKHFSNTEIVLPNGFPDEWDNIFTKETIRNNISRIKYDKVAQHLPYIALKGGIR